MADKSEKSNVVALLLYLTIGVFGVHRFYVGKKGSGALQLLCCAALILVALQFKAGQPGSAGLPLALLALSAFGVLAIWMVVDGVLIVLQKFTDDKGNTLTFSP
jgi:TM2 domain-containing membrane protein YozV